MMSSMYLNWVAIYYPYSTSLASKAMRLGLKMIVFASLILVNFISLLLSHKTMWGTWMVMQLFHNKLKPLKWLYTPVPVLWISLSGIVVAPISTLLTCGEWAIALHGRVLVP